MDIEDIKAALGALKFTSKNELTWRRSFPSGAEITCKLATSLAKSQIIYPAAMIAGRATTQSFAQAESLVVLDCVCRLLEQGYSPDSIVLEKSYTVGHNPKYLDVLILRQGAPYMMIECKTPGAEFEAECKRLARDGGQVLTYFAQDRNAEWLVVYTAKVSNGQIKAKYLGLHAQVLTGSSVSDLFSSWDKTTFSTGLFASAPYAFKEPSLLVKDLEAMTQEQGLSVFNEFEEILRRHVVSDKPNAFNKIFNLFICKVYDEQKVNPSAELDFQWRKGELPDTVLSRLTDLYRKGMLEFLKLEVADHSDTEISELLAHATEESRAAIRRAFVELRLYKTNEFAFLDVFDRQTFLRNAEIVRDVVTLLQKKRLRYKQKQPFMGDFFERLLATSVKQESGQFFTPLPIARFMLEALPVETVIDQKLQSDNEKFLPYILDYASGSGHFLTEAMDRVDKVIKKISDTDERLTRQKLRSNLSSWKSDYSWAGEFVYGIERDYRLAKTAKVSCFLNGDGDANIVRANGLDNFQNSKDYRAAGGFLSVNDDRQDNPKFDVIVANPPYSVKNFKSTVTDGPASFSLWNQLGESSKEIELLFIERTKQLMKPGGVAAIVLPNNVLQTSGAAASARMLLIRSFEIISIVTLGPGTFMKTGIGTVVLFLRRRGNHDAANAVEDARQIVDGNTSAAAVLAKAYAKEVHNTDLATFKEGLEEPHKSSLPAFVEEVRRHAESASLRALEKSANFKSLTKAKQQLARQADLKSFVQKDQMRRLEIFALTRGQTVLAVNAPAEAKEEIRFLGYKFSERRGRAGMQYTSGEEHIDTPLFDPMNIASPVKIAPLIRGLFETGKVKVPSTLEKYCHTLSAAELFDYEEQPFEATVQTRKVEPALAYLAKTERLGSICDVRIGGTPSRANPKYFKNGKNLWVGIKEMAGQRIISTTEMITDEAVASSNVKLVPADTTLVSFKLSVGKTARAGVPLYTNEAIAALVIQPAFSKQVSNDYLFALFTLFGQEVMSLNNVAALKLGKILNKGTLKNIPIPILKPTDMAKFCAEFTKHGLAAKAKLAKLLW